MIQSQYYVSFLEKLMQIEIDSEDEMKILHGCLEKILRQYSGERPPRYLSRALEDAMKSNGINIKLTHHGSIHRINRQGIKMILDHTTPVHDLIHDLMRHQSVSSVLEKNVTAGILKSEDLLLIQKGYRKSRDEDWKSCYDEDGIHIQLVENPSYIHEIHSVTNENI